VGTLQEFIQGRHYARISSLSAINDETLFLSTSIDGLLMMWPLQFVLENNPELKPTTWDRKASRIKALMTPKVLRAQSTIIEKPKGNITCSAAESYQSASVGIVGRDDGTFSVTQAFILSEGDEKDFSFHLSHFLEGELPPVGERRLGCVAVSPNFNFLVSTNGDSLQLWIYHPGKKGQKAPDRFKSTQLESTITVLTFSADEKYLMVGTEGRTVSV